MGSKIKKCHIQTDDIIKKHNSNNRHKTYKNQEAKRIMHIIMAPV